MLLRRLIGLLVVIAVLGAVGYVFWGAMHPSTPSEATFGGPPSPYSTEGGHDPNRRPGNTADELRFKGANPDTKKFQ